MLFIWYTHISIHHSKSDVRESTHKASNNNNNYENYYLNLTWSFDSKESPLLPFKKGFVLKLKKCYVIAEFSYHFDFLLDCKNLRLIVKFYGEPFRRIFWSDTIFFYWLG